MIGPWKLTQVKWLESAGWFSEQKYVAHVFFARSSHKVSFYTSYVFYELDFGWYGIATQNMGMQLIKYLSSDMILDLELPKWRVVSERLYCSIWNIESRESNSIE